ncbi:luciferase [Mycobacterium sp. IS-1742]|uniref:LLM class flavin-dependent oxidoreductase n=1 Tax=Mycobacterium sp. IS-1742 TaxID=1772285 RepID=UPI000740463C|nr:LLM class flavin-dependent oxidoreductase [Mycobacterium sp. IS-1742]KUI32487.1 luciferase [Mycobacterium sp. IS-1742]
MFTIRFDMRAPAFGAPTTHLYAAAIDMSAWAERRGCIAAVLCEHHGSEDGYLPAPLLLASAVAARTDRLALSLVVILPFHDPVRLAEEIAVLDLISAGRASYVFGLGYRPEEFEHFGLRVTQRGRLADENIALVRRLLAGATVTRDGRRITVTPRPQTPGGPALMWGGSSLAAARRAGRYGLGLLANGSVEGMREAYEAACREHGHEPGATLLPAADTPTVTFVADDVDAAWEEIGEHLLHDARTYAQWNPGNTVSAGISDARDVAELRSRFTSHRIVDRAEAAAIVRGGGLLNLSPLCGGLPPDTAWPYLERAAAAVADGTTQEGG